MDVLEMLRQSLSTQSSMLWILALSFLSGILISFTPCIYPMIPITVGIMQTQTTHSLWRGFLTGLFYVFGLAAVYATLGLISASTSMIFGQWTGNPWFILFIILLFLYLAFSLFGFYEVKIPAFFTLSSDTSFVHSPFLKSFMLGLFAGTVASPCLTPALAMLLALVAQRGSPILGFLSMFLFAFGMGFLLIFIGMFSASLNFLPSAGLWMDDVKKFFGFVMLGMCVHFSKPFVSDAILNLLYIAVCISGAVYYFYTGRRAKIKWILALGFAAAATYLLIKLF